MKLDGLKKITKTGELSALLMGLEDWLRGLLQDDLDKPRGRYVGIHDTGDPPPWAGQWYFAIHPQSVTGTSNQANYIDNYLSVAITMSVRTAMVPRDREKEAFLVGSQQSFDIASWLAGAESVHGNYSPILTAATAKLFGKDSTQQGFIRPLYFVGQKWEAKGATWWSGDSGGDSAGFAVETTFQGGQYIREVNGNG